MKKYSSIKKMILISITSVIVEVGVNIFYIMPDFKEMLENNTKAGMKDYAVSYSLKINGIREAGSGSRIAVCTYQLG